MNVVLCGNFAVTCPAVLALFSIVLEERISHFTVHRDLQMVVTVVVMVGIEKDLDGVTGLSLLRLRILAGKAKVQRGVAARHRNLGAPPGRRPIDRVVQGDLSDRLVPRVFVQDAVNCDWPAQLAEADFCGIGAVH